MISSSWVQIQWQGTGGRVEVEVAITSVLGLDSTGAIGPDPRDPRPSTGTM